MIQFYFISILFLLLSSALHLFPFFRSKMMFLLPFKQALSENKKLRIIFFIIGLIITFFLLLFPLAPGPKLLGDLIPAITTFVSSIYLLTFDTGNIKEVVKIDDKDKFFGYSIFIIALVHFLYPSGVLI